jgi:hypothetical protein
METIFRVDYVAPLQGAISEGRSTQGGARFQRLTLGWYVLRLQR